MALPGRWDPAVPPEHGSELPWICFGCLSSGNRSVRRQSLSLKVGFLFLMFPSSSARLPCHEFKPSVIPGGGMAEEEAEYSILWEVGRDSYGVVYEAVAN